MGYCAENNVKLLEKLTDSSMLIAIIMLPFILIVNPIVSINISKKLLDL